MGAIDESFLKRTIDFWEPCAEEKLTSEDAKGIIENIAGFFEILAEWEQNDYSQDSQKGGDADAQLS